MWSTQQRNKQLQDSACKGNQQGNHGTVICCKQFSSVDGLGRQFLQVEPPGGQYSCASKITTPAQKPVGKNLDVELSSQYTRICMMYYHRDSTNSSPLHLLFLWEAKEDSGYYGRLKEPQQYWREGRNRSAAGFSVGCGEGRMCMAFERMQSSVFLTLFGGKVGEYCSFLYQ